MGKLQEGVVTLEINTRMIEGIPIQGTLPIPDATDIVVSLSVPGGATTPKLFLKALGQITDAVGQFEKAFKEVFDADS